MSTKKNTDRGGRRVSVIIPAYNVAHCLKGALDSVFRQTLPAAEVIVVDDGSSDETDVVATEFYGDRIHLIRQENAGSAVARNRGLEVAKGDYIAFLDADDYWEAEFLEKTVNALQDIPEAIALLTAWYRRMPSGEKELVPEYTNELMKGECRLIEDFPVFWAKYGNVQTGAIILSRDAIKAAGMMNPVLRSSQDLEYWMLIATHGKWCFLNTPLYVNNSREAGIKGGWLAKYRRRRRLSPTVEQWQERLLSRVTPEQEPSFKVIRGRVAAGYAHSMVLGGREQEARYTVLEYGHEMPANRLVKLMRCGTCLGPLGWWFICRLVKIKEIMKSFQQRHLN